MSMKTYWISFVNKKALGVCIVDAEDERSAVEKTHTLGINPGGEAMLFEFDMHDESAIEEINRWGKNRLISPQELDGDGYIQIKDLNPAEQKKVYKHAGITRIPGNRSIEN